MNNYEDIIDMDYKKSKKYPQMSLNDRASQFAPFQALAGYIEVIKETARITDEKICLADDLKEIINRKLLIINSIIESQPKIKVIYFFKDELKKGGEYREICEKVKKIDYLNKKIIFINKQEIKIDDIIDIIIY